ncbi:MAG TPA: hypothetical protein VJH92_04815 [Candidatus Nanoarchaeia archaeon]|nr:hypothetical protein [Candidatus Nanoarchaeia archaeon]
MERVIVTHRDGFDKAKKLFAQGGLKKFHVVADFDRTLTRAYVDGEKTPSIISELRRGNYLGEDYMKKANELASFYHPIELDLKIPLHERKKAMHDWWSKHFELLLASGLNKKHITDVINDGKVRFREGVEELLDFLHSHKIPLIIISAAGLGEEAISIFLNKHGKLYSNTHIVSNSFKWDSKGNALSINKPIIHVMNKDETSVKDFGFYDSIKDRKNVLLLGDSLEDVDMVNGYDYEGLIKVGFLNEKVDENLEKYKSYYDILILDDGNMDYVNGMLNEMFVDK